MDSTEVAEIKRHFDVTADVFRSEVVDVKRHFNVVAEDLRSEIRQVAEAVTAVDQKVDREVSALRTEMKEQFDGTRAMIRLS